MHHVLIILTLTFIQGNTDFNHENNKCFIISETSQAMPITLNCCEDSPTKVYMAVYMAIASPMTLTFMQGHKLVSNLTTF